MCEDLKIPWAQWNGHKHEPIPIESNWVYLVQYISGSEGWNCIDTDTIIFYSQNYSYRIMTQAAGRIDRLNTTFSILNYYHLLSDAKIDLEIKKALNGKQTFNQSAFSAFFHSTFSHTLG
jgi:superfamily II DNA or RNA helicase